MPKIKTKKTLLKRIKITKKGKILRAQIGNGHLKEKRHSRRKHRKANEVVQKNKGHIIKLKKLIGNHAKS